MHKHVAQDKCIQTNTDYQGSDLVKGGVGATSASQCCLACKKTPGCMYWTFGTDRKTCWVKSGAKGWETQNYRNSGSLVLMSDGGCPVKGDFPVGACQSANIEQSIDYQGSDLVKGGVQANSATACCAACKKQEGCRYWTFGQRNGSPVRDLVMAYIVMATEMARRCATLLPT